MKNNFKKSVVTMLSLTLVLAMSLAFAACGKKNEAPVEEAVAVESVETADTEATVVGEGKVQFTFEVVDSEGATTLFTVNTDKKTVGEALLDVELIAGDESDYGLYVKTVNGITADYDVDKTYWAFYVDGEYASTGVDQTDVVANSTYSFKVEK